MLELLDQARALRMQINLLASHAITNPQDKNSERYLQVSQSFGPTLHRFIGELEETMNLGGRSARPSKPDKAPENLIL